MTEGRTPLDKINSAGTLKRDSSVSAIDYRKQVFGIGSSDNKQQQQITFLMFLIFIKGITLK